MPCACIPALALRFLVSLVLAAACGMAHALPTPAEVTRLIDAGQLEQALPSIEAGLQAQPRDPQWRFLRGAWLASNGQDEAAMAVFQSLTHDFPELPEPYNNLAVLQAAAGLLPQARLSLEAALRADPAYAVAWRNLADVHVRLAIEAYERAGALSPDNGSLSQRVALLRSWLADMPVPRTPQTR